jgi:hypothetical protein
MDRRVPFVGLGLVVVLIAASVVGAGHVGVIEDTPVVPEAATEAPETETAPEDDPERDTTDDSPKTVPDPALPPGSPTTDTAGSVIVRTENVTAVLVCVNTDVDGHAATGEHRRVNMSALPSPTRDETGSFRTVPNPAPPKTTTVSDRTC